MKRPWYEWIQAIDRRIIYLVVFVAVSLPFFLEIPLPMPAGEPVRKLYSKIEDIAEYNKTAKKKKYVLMHMQWTPSVQAECWPQTEAMIVHCFKKNVPFMIMGWIAEGPLLAQGIAEKKAEEMGKVYGVDWVDFGFKPMNLPAFRAFIRDLYSQIPKDSKGTPLRNVPIMRDLESNRQIDLVFFVTGSAGVEAYIQYMQPETGTDIASGCTAIIGPEMYSFLDSGQLVGMMEGLSGAAQYEYLIGYEGRGTRGQGSQNLAHFWIIAMMVLGNVGYVFQRRRERKERQKIEMAGE
jgi:hypothetical protein